MSDAYLTGLAAHLDWNHPWLADLPGHLRDAEPRTQLLAAIAAMRRQPAGIFGFDADYHAKVQASASADDRVRAVTRLDKALSGDLFFPPHSNAIAAVGHEMLALAMDEAHAERLAAGIMARQADWPRNIWGFGLTHGVSHLLCDLAPLPTVPDEVLLPVLGWLCAIAPVEWQSARSWGDRVLGPSGHNWYVHSHYGLWIAGAVAGFLRPLRPLRALAPTQLEREVHLLFAADGWSKEGAAGYHRFAFGNVLAFAHHAERHGVRFSAAFHAKLRTIADATWRLQGPDGDGPVFGDDGIGGKNAYERKSTVLLEASFGIRTRRLAARFGLSEALGAANAMDPHDPAQPLTFLPEDGHDLAPALQGVTAMPPPLDTGLPVTGLWAIRNRWAADGDWLAFNAKGIGPTVTSHQHADLLNFELCVRGRRVIVDNWYGDLTADDGSYQSAPEIRNNPMKRRWRVGSSAHNVVTVDGEDIVPVVQIYRYGWHETPMVDAAVGDARYAFLSAVHEAWRRLPQPVVSHSRSIFYLRDRYWVLFDRLAAANTEPHVYDQHFHLLSGVQRTPAGQVYTVGDGGNVLLAPVPGLTGELHVEPCPYPISTYQNPDHLRFTKQSDGALEVLFATVLVPFADGAVPTVRVEAVPVHMEGDAAPVAASAATGLRITIDGETHVLVRQHAHWNAPWTCDGHHGSGRLYHSAIGEVADNPLAR